MKNQDPDKNKDPNQRGNKDEEQERSESGAPIYRYEETPPNDFELAIGDEENITAISDHIEANIGPVDSVFHELISDQVHIDVHWVKPSSNFPFHLLVTSGMSDKPMNVPTDMEDFESYQYTELCILLPKDWKIQGDKTAMDEVFSDETVYWPIRWLKMIARFPHEYNTWVGWGHTIPNGEFAEPFADNTKLGCMILLPPMHLPESFFELPINDNKTICFYALYPLYPEEMNFKLEKGLDALLDKFQEFDVPHVVDPARVNTCKKKKGLFGLW